jgi:hypothetical protein
MTLLRFTVSRVHKIILYTVIGVTSVIDIVFWFLLTLQCQPVSYFWKRAQLTMNPMADIHGSCINLNRIIAMAYVYSAAAAACDFTLGLLPVWIVWKLQMNKRTKAALASILGMGCVYDLRPSCSIPFANVNCPSASAAVIIRIPYLKDYKDPNFLCEFVSGKFLPRAKDGARQSELMASDLDLDATAYIAIWSNIEASLGIAAGSLVTMRPLMRWFRDPRSLGYRTRADRVRVVLSAEQSASSTVPQYWRSDIEPEDVITTVQTSHQPYRTSSQV